MTVVRRNSKTTVYDVEYTNISGAAESTRYPYRSMMLCLRCRHKTDAKFLCHRRKYFNYAEYARPGP